MTVCGDGDRRRARARTTIAAVAAVAGVAAVTAVFESLAARQLRSDMAVFADRLLDEGEVRAASALAVGALSTQTDILALLSIGEDEATRNIAETTLREAGLHLDPVVNLGAPNSVSFLPHRARQLRRLRLCTDGRRRHVARR